MKIREKYIAATFIILLMTGFTFLMSSCNDNTIFVERKHIEAGSWKTTDTLYYQFSITDTITPVDIYFNVRNSVDYQNQNLYIFLTAFYPGNKFSRDTIDISLAEPDGKWIGKGSGAYRDVSFLFRKNLTFTKPGIYTLAINQAMRTKELKGISDFGIRIDKQNSGQQ